MNQLGLDLGGDLPAAVIDGPYRYELVRPLGWRACDGPLLEWIMLNPSKANAIDHDPTVRRCWGFARAWGFAGIRVTNLFALRATDPRRLFEVDDPVGPNNHRYLRAEYGPVTVCAWGAHRAVADLLGGAVHDLIAARSALMCLGTNGNGSPKHPLYVARTRGPRPWPQTGGVHHMNTPDTEG